MPLLVGEMLRVGEMFRVGEMLRVLDGASFVGGVCRLEGKSSSLLAASASAFDAGGDSTPTSDLTPDSDLTPTSGLGSFKFRLVLTELFRLDVGDRKSGVGDKRISLMPVLGEVSNPESPIFLLIELSADAFPDFALTFSASFDDELAPLFDTVWAPPFGA